MRPKGHRQVTSKDTAESHFEPDKSVGLDVQKTQTSFGQYQRIALDDCERRPRSGKGRSCTTRHCIQRISFHCVGKGEKASNVEDGMTSVCTFEVHASFCIMHVPCVVIAWMRYLIHRVQRLMSDLKTSFDLAFFLFNHRTCAPEHVAHVFPFVLLTRMNISP